jgi:hypothetical protein
MVVHQLVDQNNCNWKLVREILYDINVEEILRIPLLMSQKRYQIIWRFDKHGNYTVKSAHRVCMERPIWSLAFEHHLRYVLSYGDY